MVKQIKQRISRRGNVKYQHKVDMLGWPCFYETVGKVKRRSK